MSWGFYTSAGSQKVGGSAWNTYTVSWTAETTNPAIGNGTITGRYYQLGKTVYLSVKLTAGSTTTFGTGAWRFSLPVAAYAAEGIMMTAACLDNGVAWYQASAVGTYGGSTSYTSILADSTGTTSTAVTYNTPFTWGSVDSLIIGGAYESV
jgi:hypothetical protein